MQNIDQIVQAKFIRLIKLINNNVNINTIKNLSRANIKNY